MISYKIKYHYDKYDDANQEFNLMVESNTYEYLRIVYSGNIYSQGYWIEKIKSNLSNDDFLLKEYDGRANLRKKLIEEILKD